MKVIKAKETYNVNGIEKTVWYEVGTVFNKGDKEYLKLNSNPYIVYYIFPIEKTEKKDISSEEQVTTNVASSL